MKKILLASTFLAGTAGFAVADDANFSFSGEAAFGFVYIITPDGADADTDNDTLFVPTVSSEFTAAMMTTTDMGLEASASITVEAFGVSVETDPTDGDFGVVTYDGGGAISEASVSLSGDWGTFTAGWDDPDMEFTYANTWGDFSLDVYYTMIDLAGDTSDDDEFGAEVGYAFGDYNAYVGFDGVMAPTGGDMDLSYYVGGDATFSSVTVSAEVTFDPDEATDGDAAIDYEAGLAYATGPYSFGATIYGDNDDTTDFDGEASASYDLGGGVSVDLGVGYDGGVADVDDNTILVSLGVSMAF